MEKIEHEVLRTETPELLNRAFTLGQILQMPTDPEPFLLENALLKSKVQVLIGSSDAGKSYFCLDLARAVCNQDETFVGLKICRTHCGTALIFSSEDSADDIKERFAKMDEARLAKAKEGLQFVFETDNVLVELRKRLSENKFDLVVLDTFGDFFKGTLNDSTSVRDFYEPFKKLATQHKCCILFIHHIGKAKENSPRQHKNDSLGSQAVVSAPRAAISLRKQDNGDRLLTVVKGNRLSEEHKNRPLQLTFDPKNGFQRKTEGGSSQSGAATNVPIKDNPEIVELVKKHQAKGLSCRQSEEAFKNLGLSVGKTTVSEIRKKLELSEESPPLVINPDGQQDAA